MNPATPLTAAELAALDALAAGIIPADSRDAGARNFSAPLAERARRAGTLALYAAGLTAAAQLAHDKFSRPVAALSPAEIHRLLAALLASSPAFFRALRADTCALYLADPAVLARIGFPGASAAGGGYPQFDQPPVTHADGA